MSIDTKHTDGTGTIRHHHHTRTMVVTALMKTVLSAGTETITATGGMYITAYITAPDPQPLGHAIAGRKSKGDKRRDRAERRRKWGI